jgi:hypothetical protein
VRNENASREGVNPLTKFFLSNSEDLVDPHYNFLTDEHRADRDRWRDDVYPHQLFSEPICDGVFLSGVAQPSIKRRVETAGNVHAFLRLSPDFPVMGDCGAFNYKDKAVPPYETGEILEIYQHYGYTLGASIDHLVDPKSPTNEKQRRWDITIRNAEDFIGKYRAARFTFTPVGVVQGWDPLSYRQAVEKLLEFGYKYIAIGGVTRLHTKYLKPILKEISTILPADVDLHLLGIAKLSDLSLFQRSGVTSLNGSTPIKRGTMGEYWTLGSRKYEAIRVPSASKEGRRYRSSARGLRRLDDIFGEGEISETKFRDMEQTCLSLLRAYDKGQVSLDEVLNAVLHYNRLNGDKQDRRDKYEETLHDQPWRSCLCDICQKIGIEVIIFRGNDRNRRRGFHNAWVFYRQLQIALETKG